MHAVVWLVCDHGALQSRFRGASAFRTNCREVAYVTMNSPPGGKTSRGCHPELWSAAACCRFGSSQLAGGELFPRLKSRRASSRGGKRQLAAALARASLLAGNCSLG